MSEIEAALTVEEWVEMRVEWTTAHQVCITMPRVLDLPPGGIQHKVAAACLHEQEFGFSWEDVGLLNSVRPELGTEKEWDRLFGLTNRIAALLPPRGET